MSVDQVAKTVAFFETLSKSMDKVRAYLRPRIPPSFTELPKTKPDALSIEYKIEFLDERFSVARTWTATDPQTSDGKLTRETKLSLALLRPDGRVQPLTSLEAHNIPNYMEEYFGSLV